MKALFKFSTTLNRGKAQAQVFKIISKQQLHAWKKVNHRVESEVAIFGGIATISEDVL